MTPGAAEFELSSDDRSAIRVLVVDDEHSLRESCASILEGEGFDVTVCGRGNDAEDLLRRKVFDVALLDVHMSQVPGARLMEIALEHNPEILVIFMTGRPSLESSLASLLAGAWNYIPKPFAAAHLKIMIGQAAHAVHAIREVNDQMWEGDPGSDDGSGIRIIAESDQMRRVLALARRVAPTDASVYLTGESGTGKDLISRYVHAHSRRARGPFVPVNCAALSESLLESEMFGHLAGAFTGAVNDTLGIMGAADGGTLFLDEVVDMPAVVQAKLLRVLQDGMLRRVGSSTADVEVDVRVISATNRDPAKAISEGRLRADLDHRLRVIPIHIPPLRERVEDIPALAEHVLRETWSQYGSPGEPTPVLTEGAMAKLKTHHWRGNVRELQNVVQHAVVLSDPGHEIEPEELTFNPMVSESTTILNSGFTEYLNWEYREARDRVVEEFELNYLRHVIRRAGGNISDASRAAGVDRTTLYRLMEKYGEERGTLLDPSAAAD